MANLRPTHAAPDDVESRAQQLVDLVGARVHHDIVIPRTGIRAKLRLCSRSEISEARAEARRALEANGFPVDASAVTALGAGDEWTYELAIRVLAVAVRDPSNVGLALASLEDWRECDDSQIAALGKMYEDLEAELDPLGDNSAPLTEADHAAIVNAAKKKERAVLMSFGSRKLSAFLLTSADQPASSPTLKS